MFEVGEGIASGLNRQRRPNAICRDGEIKVYVHDDDNDEDATDLLRMVVILFVQEAELQTEQRLRRNWFVSYSASWPEFRGLRLLYTHCI